MVESILYRLSDYLNFITNIDNPEEFCKLNDNILDYIENINIDQIEEEYKKDILETKKIISDLRNRKLLKIKNKIQPNFLTKTNMNLENIYFYNKNDTSMCFNY